MRRTFVLLASLIASPALAQPLVPPPGDAAYDATLAAHVSDWSRVQDHVLSLPVGFGLEGAIADPAHRTLVTQYVTSGMTDFQAATGSHPYAVLDAYDEQGDLGMFGGVQAAGLAWRYVVLRDHGGSASDVAEARAALLRAVEGLHWITAVTGVPGGVVRGIMRITPEHAGEPPLPGGPITTTPLFDATGSPQPAMKQPTWRADASGMLPFLAWLDDCSKDQLDGYVIALGAAYDAIVGDPMIDQSLVDRLRADCAAIGQRLMMRVAVGGGHTADLVIVDADGRPTSFHDLSAEEVTPGVVSTRPINGFNALMALGIVRTLYHVSGDATLGHFYYQTLVGDRGYLQSATSTVRLMYQGPATNYSNVNMAFVAVYGVLRYETDPMIQASIRDILESQLYAPGVDRQASGLGLPFFDHVYAGFRVGGATDSSGMAALTQAMATMTGYPSAPIWEPDMTNCDASEIAAMHCIGLDGTTNITLLGNVGHGNGLVAQDVLPIAIRPHTDFEHRSDPHRVNGSATTTLDPAGDIVASYWLGRMLDRAGGTTNVSPNARAALPWTAAHDAGVTIDAGSDAAMSATHAGDVHTCGCRVQPTSRPPSWLLLIGMVAALRRRVATSRA
jgi:MYXO-CTERM domain-containing protein